MAEKLKAGDKVRVITPVIKGTITGWSYDDNENRSLAVEWTDEAGEVHSRWFDPAELELDA